MSNQFSERPKREDFDAIALEHGGTPAHLDEVIKAARKYFGNPADTPSDAAEHIKDLFETHPDFTDPETGGRTKLYFCFWAITEFFLRDTNAHERLKQFFLSEDFPDMNERGKYIRELLSTFLPPDLSDSELVATVTESYSAPAGNLMKALVTTFYENYSHGLLRSPAASRDGYNTFLGRMRAGAGTMHRFLTDTSQLLNAENDAVTRYLKVMHRGMNLEDVRKEIMRRSLRFAQRVAMNHIIFSQELLFEGKLSLYQIPKSGGGHEIIAATDVLYNLYENKQVPVDVAIHVKDAPSSGCPMAYSGIFLQVGNAMIDQLYRRRDNKPSPSPRP